MNIFLLKLTKLNIIVLAISSIIILNIFSCNDNDNNMDDIANDDIYYVNYIIKGPSPYGRFSNWTATTPNGTFSNYSGVQVGGWNQTYGPVQSGFQCRVEIGDHQGGTPTIEIHVSKNEGPFALKRTVTGTSASYTIN